MPLAGDNWGTISPTRSAERQTGGLRLRDNLGADVVYKIGRQHRPQRYREVRVGPARSETLCMLRTSTRARTGRSRARPSGRSPGRPLREG